MRLFFVSFFFQFCFHVHFFAFSLYLLWLRFILFERMGQQDQDPFFWRFFFYLVDCSNDITNLIHIFIYTIIRLLIESIFHNWNTLPERLISYTCTSFLHTEINLYLYVCTGSIRCRWTASRCPRRLLGTSGRFPPPPPFF